MGDKGSDQQGPASISRGLADLEVSIRRANERAPAGTRWVLVDFVRPDATSGVRVNLMLCDYVVTYVEGTLTGPWYGEEPRGLRWFTAPNAECAMYCVNVKVSLCRQR